jgi:signal transduction histidine kinase/CheY-like chemotaxis protein
MPASVVAAFQSERGRFALEKCAVITHLTVEVYGVDAPLVAGPLHATPLFDLFAPTGHGAGLVADCRRRCLAQPSAVVVEERLGLAVAGMALRLDEEVVAVVLGEYALTKHLDRLDILRLARAAGLPDETVWAVVRRVLPVPRPRLVRSGELLGVVGETLLSDERHSRQLEESSARLMEADEAKDRFLATVSHELRTPLHAILGWTNVLRTRRGDETMFIRALETIERNARMQAGLIEDLLDVSRMVTGKLTLDIQPVDLASVIEAALDVVRPAAEAKGLRLESRLDAPVGRVAGDPARLQQVVSNLLVNAVKFSATGGRVEVRLQALGPDVQVTVSDTGQGIAPDFLPYVFERLRQADATSTRAQTGLGLGLAIVRHLVELHGGTVRADSPGEGQGATFTVTLPLAPDLGTGGEPEVAERGRWEATGSAAKAGPGSLDGVRVLVVDDERDARDFLALVLQRAGASVIAAGSAAEALRVLESDKVDVLLADVAMPGEDGYALIRKVRALSREQRRCIPAAAVTAYAGVADHDRALSEGFDRHVVKPVAPDDLVALVASLAGRI